MMGPCRRGGWRRVKKGRIMDEILSNRWMFLLAVALGFVSGFSWVVAVQPLMVGRSPAYASAD